MTARISQAFQRRSIQLAKKIEDYPESKMPNGVTNKYFQVHDRDNNTYLVRQNGKLWPPFTRQAEDFNLQELRAQQIETNVLINDSQHGFQICRLYSQDLAMSHWGPQLNLLITNVAEQISLYQSSVRRYEGAYPLVMTITSSFARLKPEHKDQLKRFYDIISKIAVRIQEDKENHAFSHNDLQASSVYNANNSIVMVDWEYAGENHKYFDLAFISVKNKLTAQQEALLLKSYNAEEYGNNKYVVSLLKSVISFMDLEWKIGRAAPHQRDDLVAEFSNYFNQAVISFAYQGIGSDLVICLVKERTAKQETRRDARNASLQRKHLRSAPA